MNLCGRGAALDNGYSTKESMHFVLARVLKEVLKVVELNDTKDVITKKVEDAFDQVGQEIDLHEYFLNEFSITAQKELMAKNLFRYAAWAHANSHKIIKRDMSVPVLLNGKVLKVKTDLLVETAIKGTYNLIKFNNGKPHFTSKAANKNSVTKEPEAWKMQKAADFVAKKLETKKKAQLAFQGLTEEEIEKRMAEDKILVIPAFYSLKAADDKTRLRIDGFESKKEENVVSFRMTKAEMNTLKWEMSHFTPDLKDTACGNCSQCGYNDLCNLEFVERKAKAKAPVEVEAEKEAKMITLSPQQRDIVNATSGCIQVNAVAGSGKTTVITIRSNALLEEMLEEDETDRKILMLTFTEKAARNMKVDLKKWYKAFNGVPMPATVSNMIETGTFNSWGMNLICQNYAELGFTAEPVVVDDRTKKKIVEELLEVFPKLPLDYEHPTMDLPFAKGCIIEMAKLMDSFKSAGVETPNDVLKLKKDWRKTENVWYGLEGVALDFYNKYNEKLFAQNCLDYEDQLRLLPKLRETGLFKTLPYSHVVIDEYQDSDNNQIAILKAVIEDCPGVKSLAVVGDVMQSIYSFRNTSADNILNFGRDFRGAKYFELSTNYRSSEEICNYANTQIANDPDIKKATKLSPARGKVYTPAIAEINKLSEGIVTAVEKIKKWQKEGRPLEEMAVIARNKGELLEVQAALTAAGIKSTLKVPEVISENPYVKAMFGLNNYIKNKDELGFALYLKSKGEDPFDFAKVKEEGEKLLTHLEGLSMPEKINCYMELLEEISKKDFVAEKFFEAIKRDVVFTLNDLTENIYEYEYYAVKDTVNEAIENGGVTLITIHSSKGLEYKNVVLFITKIKDTPEEKRILYVGVTRAQDDLLIIADKKQRTLLNLLTVKRSA